MTANAPAILYYASTAAPKLNKDQRHHQCQLRPYKPGCPDPFTPHHCVPDHCWKTEAGEDAPRITIPPPNGATMSHKDGLCICVDGPSNSWGCNILDINRNDLSKSEVNKERLDTHISFLEDELKKTGISTEDKKSLTRRRDALNNIRNQMDSKETMSLNDFTQKITASSLVSATPGFANLGQHPKIHHVFDAAEVNLANENRQIGLGEHVATLGQLEELAADVLSKITKCNKNSLRKQMRAYHHHKNFNKNTLLRASETADLSGNSTLGKSVKLRKTDRNAVKNAISSDLQDTYVSLGIP